jgi:hypothetical protein
MTSGTAVAILAAMLLVGRAPQLVKHSSSASSLGGVRRTWHGPDYARGTELGHRKGGVQLGKEREDHEQTR